MAPIEFDNRKKRTVRLENSLTPAEIASLIEGDPAGELQFELRSVFESGQTPVGYARQVWRENSSFYTANKGARGLIVVFCGLRDWPGIPTSYLLQTLRDDLYDVLVLQDPLALHFDRGISGHACLFEYWHDVPLRSRLLGLVEDAALHIHRLQAIKREQHERQLQEIYEGTAWWLTRPLRGLDVAMRRLKGEGRA